MQWFEVFDKYFIINGRLTDVLVFIPGTYNGESIRYAWTTVGAIEAGLDYSSLVSTLFRISGDEASGTGSQFNNWKPIKQISQEERVCRKIRVMEERWRKFQEGKKAVPPKVVRTFVRTSPSYTQEYVTIDYNF